ncbi:molybdopterin oxidoreductase, iron-sulfur binding subunit [Candidatus Magnetobacterium bavaricum]|uniref:Molybdopterin oxidoreductase, iron-sulfur binding subunit n=1 Tax=Candidatus Magnetobacterium bavaricum TaxID=29290 RepID=A0A0F3GXB4_9BACT|nr:molybdopterin oxidoreductase, iron-sulfur binding subunit [Candidatus Magnetobacterium bavaricum]
MAMKRRDFLKRTAGAVSLAAAFALEGVVLPARDAEAIVWEEFFQKYFREMTQAEKDAVAKRLEADYKKRFGKDIKVSTKEPLPKVLYGYGLDLSRCIGCRRCVYACVTENNLSRKPQIEYITVLRFKSGEKWVDDFEGAEKYYNPELVPEPEHFYMPVQCQQCERPACTKVCPTKATWKEPDGIVVVDYNWCIGCRYCMAACPYGARKFNWAQPTIPTEQINPNTHYLGNRIKHKGCVEKCTFCIQRVRENPGRYPACVEICPVGARKFGNLLDEKSEIRMLIETKRVFRLKEMLNTNPKFYYFFSL